MPMPPQQVVASAQPARWVCSPQRRYRMAAGPSWMMMLLVMLLGGGGSDLLDYVPSDFYWKKQNVQVAAETLLTELKPVTSQDISKFIPDLDSADPQVRDKATKG